MSDWGMKTSLEGSEVSTASVDALSMTSQYASPKIKLSQTPAHFGIYEKTWGSVSNGSFTLLTIEHGYGYKCASVCMVSYPVGVEVRNNFLPYIAGGLTIYNACDTTNFYVYGRADGVGDTLSGQVWKFKYYIFVDNGA